MDFFLDERKQRVHCPSSEVCVTEVDILCSVQKKEELRAAGGRRSAARSIMSLSVIEGNGAWLHPEPQKKTIIFLLLY